MMFVSLFLLLGYSLCVTDKDVLDAFYKSTNGQNWINNAGWDSDDVCSRFGVSCDDAGRVSTLYLQKNNLQGPLPLNFGYLTHLTGLDLSGNQVNGTFPKTMANMKNLMAMFVFYC